MKTDVRKHFHMPQRSGARRLAVGIAMLLMAVSTLSAQEGFGIWTSGEVTKKLAKGLNLSVEGEFRSAGNLSQVDRWDIGPSLSYRICPYLKVEGGYTYLYNYNATRTKFDTDQPTLNDGYYSIEKKKYSPYWVSRHRANFDLSTGYTFGRISLTLRERYQYTYEKQATTKRVKSKLYYATAYDEHQQGYPFMEEVEESAEKEIGEKTYDAEGKNVLRSKLTAEYNIQHCSFDPFASLELWHSLDNGCSIKKSRVTLGVTYKINKKNAVDVGYLIQHEANSTQKNLYALSLSYSFKF
jgi:hypothetical protein